MERVGSEMPGKATREVSHQYFIRRPRNEVFRAISDPKWLTRWLCDRAELTPRTGGSYSLGWTDGPTHTGTIEEFRPGRRVALVWSWPGVKLRGTIFSLSVKAATGGTILEVVHTGFPKSARWTELYGGAEWGWTYFAVNLKSVLETGYDLRSRLDG
jgi:uncharacterized protein YndB with AHSA1/START domain